MKLEKASDKVQCLQGVVGDEEEEGNGTSPPWIDSSTSVLFKYSSSTLSTQSKRIELSIVNP